VTDKQMLAFMLINIKGRHLLLTDIQKGATACHNRRQKQESKISAAVDILKEDHTAVRCAVSVAYVA
jgi:hypothetical protein